MRRTLLSLTLFLIIITSGFSQCSLNPFIEANYELDAKFLALREILSDPADPDFDNPFLPEARVTPILEKLSAIYENPNNEPLIDSLFNEFQFRVNQEHSRELVIKENIEFGVDGNAPWLQGFKDTGISGVPALDNLMSDYQLIIEFFFDSNNCNCTVFNIQTSFDFLNMHALENDFLAIPDITLALAYLPDPVGLRLNYTGIPYQVEFEPVAVCDILVENNVYSFCLYSGDCFSGCTHQKCWNILVSEDCTEITILSTSDIEISKFSIHPNPANEVIYLSGVTAEIEMMMIYSVTGKRIRTLSSYSEIINISNLQSGIYFIEIITSEGNKQTQKFIKHY